MISSNNTLQNIIARQIELKEFCLKIDVIFCALCSVQMHIANDVFNN